jgi:hypothetical protein
MEGERAGGGFVRSAWDIDGRGVDFSREWRGRGTDWVRKFVFLRDRGGGEEEFLIRRDEVGEGDGDGLARGGDEDGFGAVFLQGLEGAAKVAAVDAGPEAFFGGGCRDGQDAEECEEEEPDEEIHRSGGISGGARRQGAVG